MSLLKRLFVKKEVPIASYTEFWNWFLANEQHFYRIVESGNRVEEDLLNPLIAKISTLQEGFFFVTGMCDKNTAELIVTADGCLKNVVFVEELVGMAPNLPNWKFTALKPELPLEDVNIHIEGCLFNGETLSFYAIEHEHFPDEIDIVIVHQDKNPTDRSIYISGVHNFLDHYLGELKAATIIDNLNIYSSDEAEKECIPIAKLKDYLIWREKEFVEKYENIRHSSEFDGYASLEAKLQSGKQLFAILNTTLLEWDEKASHPWIFEVELHYSSDDNSGLPDKSTRKKMDDFEEALILELKDTDGYLNVGRQTANDSREIYFACKDFRVPSKVLHKFQRDYAEQIEMTYDCYKDKYWQSFERFRPNQ